MTPLDPLAIAAVSLCGVALEAAARLVARLSFVALAQAGAMGWSESLHLALATWGLVLLPTVFLLLVFACLGRPCAGGSDQG